MTDKGIIEGLRNIINEIKDEDVEFDKDTDVVIDLGFDSLEIFVYISKIEDCFCIDLSGMNLLENDFTVIGNMAAIIKSMRG